MSQEEMERRAPPRNRADQVCGRIYQRIAQVWKDRRYPRQVGEVVVDDLLRMEAQQTRMATAAGEMSVWQYCEKHNPYPGVTLL